LEVSVAELLKDNDVLYTMWWFDSGKYKTGSQWDWRWKSISQKEDFYLINITAESLDTLHTEALALLNKKIIE